MNDRRPSVLERRRRNARIVAIVVAAAFVATATLPMLAFAAHAAGPAGALATTGGVAATSQVPWGAPGTSGGWIVGVVAMGALVVSLAVLIVRMRNRD